MPNFPPYEGLVHIEDLVIRREGFHARLYDADGDSLGTLPADWTDDHISQAVIFANGLYMRGVRAGRNQQMADLRSTFAALFGGITQQNTL
jgi:hypothetical protein